MRQFEHYQSLTTKQALNLAAPRSWVASALPALFGIFFCWQQGFALTGLRGTCILIACVFLQSAVNTLNDYFDFIKGTDTTEDQLEITDAVLLYENIAPTSALKLGILYMSIGVLLGLVVCISSGLVPIVIGIIGGIVILLYSGGPIPISYLPIGELVSGFVMGGLIPLGVAGCSDGCLHWQILFYALPLIIGIALIMMSNNGSDIEKDMKAGRHTLPVCIGRKSTLKLYRCLIIFWMALVVILPIILIGVTGLVSLVLIVIAGRKPVQKQLSSTLEPSERISTMSGIAMTNIVFNGAYVVAIAVGAILGGFYG